MEVQKYACLVLAAPKVWISLVLPEFQSSYVAVKLGYRHFLT